LRILEYATSVNELHLSDNLFSDSSILLPISGLTSLAKLYLNDSQITDISALEYMTGVNELDLSDNVLSDANDLLPISGLTSLEKLYLNNSQITDLSGLEYATGMNELYLSGNVLSDANDLLPISGLTSLVKLHLNDSQITDLSGLEYATGVNELYLSDNALSDPNDLLPISGLTSLVKLYLNNSQITDLSGLEYATDVNELYLSNNAISDLSPVSSLTSLVKLFLNNNQIIDISAVSSLVNLETLFLSINDINDISPFSDPNLASLTNLYLGSNEIIDISSLSGLSYLTTLDLTSNQIDDISDVSYLTSLTELYLANNQIIDVPDMSSLTSLQYLHLTNNQIRDIVGLIGDEPNDLVSLSLSDNLLGLTSYCTYLPMIEDNNPLLISLDVDDYPLDALDLPTVCLANDVCGDAIDITDTIIDGGTHTGIYLGTSSGATGIKMCNCGEGTDTLWDYNDVWHSYTPPSDEVVDISLCGSSFDTTLAVYDSCGGTELICNDQWCDSQSLVTMDLTGGITYLIRIAGYFYTTGDYTLTIQDAPAPPVNNTCPDATEIFPYTTVTGSTITAYGTDITSCTLSDSRDVWYKFIPPSSGRYMIDPNGSDYNATLAVFSDCAGTEITCNDLYCDMGYDGWCEGAYESRIVVDLDEGETYYIRISGYASKGGTYALTVTLAADIYKGDGLDGQVDINDLISLVEEWLEDGISYADIAVGKDKEVDGSGGDKVIDVWDFVELSKEWLANLAVMKRSPGVFERYPVASLWSHVQQEICSKICAW